MEAADRGGESSRLRALLPLVLCVFVFSSILGWLYHSSRARQAAINFSVRIDGTPAPFYRASLNGSPYQSGQSSGLGSKTLYIEAENAEPFRTNLHIWYSGANLGTVDLPFSQGTLALDIAPFPNKVSIRGERFRKQIVDCSTQSFVVPVGTYVIESEFEHFRIQGQSTVVRNNSTTASIRPKISAINLSAEPPDAQFRLEATSPFPVALSGATPATITNLPQGQYQLSIWRGKFQKTFQIALNPDPTNTLLVKFDYAQVEFKSEPPGAEIKDGGEIIGTTPHLASFIPGSHQITIQKSGYVAKDFDLSVTNGEHQRIEAILPNIAFLEAMSRARSAMNQFNPDFPLALQETDKALQIQADDSTAKLLRNEIVFRQLLANAQNLAAKNDIEGALKIISLALEKDGSDPTALALKSQLQTAKRNATERAIEERRQRPQKLFSQAINAIQYNEFFETQTMSVQAKGDKIRGGVLKALGAKPNWTIRSNRDMGDGIFLVDAEWKSLISKQRVVLLIDQTGDSSSKIYFRLLDYILGNNIQISFKEGISDDSWRPLHRNYSSWTPPVVEQQRARSIQVFRQKLEAELNSL
jgi:hypothetical protein